MPLVNTPIGVNHTSPKIGFRLPAGAKFAHFESSPGLLATNTWDYLAWLRSVTSLPIVPKGIMTRDDAARAVDAGAAGIIVSNHGGRQLARSISTLDALPDVVAGAGGAEVYLDGGVRSGGDVLIALALGARAVLVARPVCGAWPWPAPTAWPACWTTCARASPRTPGCAASPTSPPSRAISSSTPRAETVPCG